MSKSIDKASIEASAESLRDLLAPRGTERRTLYSILRHVSKSGASRRISFLVADRCGVNLPDCRVRDVTWHVGNVTGYRAGARGQGLVVNGGGMDMGFQVAYALGQALWPKGTPEPHGTRNGVPDSEGGYAIKHSWL